MQLTPHHAATIRNLVAALEPDHAIRALLLGGSIAHGFARPDSDVDVLMVLDTSDHEQRHRENRLHYNNRELCTYPGGYIDGKFTDVAFLRRIARDGSDAARYAFCDARILFSRVPDLEALLAAIVRYPAEEKAARMTRFTAQLLAWRWYFSEAVRQQSAYLTHLAQQKITLFSCRLVLTANERLFPYHKWVLRVTARAEHRPATLMSDLDAILGAPTWPMVDHFCRDLLAFYGIDFAQADAIWPTQFMRDTELAWMTGHPPIDDL